MPPNATSEVNGRCNTYGAGRFELVERRRHDFWCCRSLLSLSSCGVVIARSVSTFWVNEKFGCGGAESTGSRLKSEGRSYEAIISQLALSLWNRSLLQSLQLSSCRTAFGESYQRCLCSYSLTPIILIGINIPMEAPNGMERLKAIADFARAFASASVPAQFRR